MAYEHQKKAQLRRGRFRRELFRWLREKCEKRQESNLRQGVHFTVADGITYIEPTPAARCSD